MADHNPNDPPLERTYKGDPLIGSTVGEYVVRERIGTGGAGIVYRGEHPAIGKPVAIKVLKPELAEDPAQMRALLEEARVVNAIGDRGIVDVFGFGQLPDGRQYLVMEYLQGDRLEALYREKKLGVSEVLGLLDRILRALGAAHGAGVIHRDLKPQNIFAMKAPDGSRYIKLLDFGLARRVSGRSRETAGGTFAGTPNYMSPEQIRREPLTLRSDLYSVGAIAFELFTGKPPFAAATTNEVVQLHLSAPIPSVRTARPDVPAELDAVLTRLLAKRADERPASAESVRDELLKLRKALRQASAKRDAKRLPGDSVVGSDPRLPASLDDEAATQQQQLPKAVAAAGNASPSARPPPSAVEFLPLSSDDSPGAVPAGGSFLRMMVLGGAVFALIGLVLFLFSARTAPTAEDGASTTAAGSTTQLLARIDGLLTAVQREAAYRGQPANEGALAQLRRLRIEAVAAKGPLEVARVDRLVSDWERQLWRQP